MNDTNQLSLSDTQREALARAGVILAYLHGSVAQGAARTDSDVDVAVLFESKPPDAVVATTDVLRALAGFVSHREIDIAILNDASPLLAQSVAVHGVLLYARGDADRLAFDIRTMHAYEFSRRITSIGRSPLLAPIAV
jgi:predicted nucleotidyltransferase